jgi:hypothetical protein
MSANCDRPPRWARNSPSETQGKSPPYSPQWVRCGWETQSDMVVIDDTLLHVTTLARHTAGYSSEERGHHSPTLVWLNRLVTFVEQCFRPRPSTRMSQAAVGQAVVFSSAAQRVTHNLGSNCQFERPTVCIRLRRSTRLQVVMVLPISLAS